MPFLTDDLKAPFSDPLQPDNFAVDFKAPDAGRIEFAVRPMTWQRPVRADHWLDPFADLMRWLEAILDGAPTARWMIESEEGASQFVFLAASARRFSSVPGQLMLLQQRVPAMQTPPHYSFIQSMRIATPFGVISTFYEAFRAFAESAAYKPQDWQRGYISRDRFNDWRGQDLRTLRSPKIEAALRERERRRRWVSAHHETTTDRYGLRCQERTGWQIVTTTLRPASLIAMLQRRGLTVAELRPVESIDWRWEPDWVSASTPSASFKPEPTIWWYPRMLNQYELCVRTGWTFDEIARCYRPPDEPLTFPNARPEQATDFAVRFDMPEAGWLPIVCSAGTVSVSFEASWIYDPIPALVTWLVDVANGANRRFALDDEHSAIEFHIDPMAGTPRADTLVRFVIAFADAQDTDAQHPDRTFELDIVIDRHALVAAFYRPLRERWASPEFRSNLHEWFEHYDPELPEEEGNDTYVVANAYLDEIILK